MARQAHHTAPFRERCAALPCAALTNEHALALALPAVDHQLELQEHGADLLQIVAGCRDCMHAHTALVSRAAAEALCALVCEASPCTRRRGQCVCSARLAHTPPNFHSISTSWLMASVRPIIDCDIATKFRFHRSLSSAALSAPSPARQSVTDRGGRLAEDGRTHPAW